MTQDEIIEMARQFEHESGFKWCVNFIELVAFAYLVAAKEREACVQVAFSWNQDITDIVALEIRARGEQA